MAKQAIHHEPKATTSPSKTFFVDMLTRDIDLKDALLDLLDNCLDGVVRQNKDHDDEEMPYEGYYAKISVCGEFFQIEDNCGGIPLEVAITRAFAMGARPGSIEESSREATIGMYGIGMKRAIFKMGHAAFVESSSDKHFNVEIDPDWMSDAEWRDLPINLDRISKWELEEKGTRIRVNNLRPEVSKQFDSKKWFDDFQKEVARHYALIISKGFKVFIGRPEDIESNLEDTEISPENFILLSNLENQIEPIIYYGEMGGVKFQIYAGLTSKPLDKNQIEKGITDTTGKYKINKSGWTVACNNRIVVWQNRTNLTGWGTGGVPSYHNQYTPIAGLVLLHSDDTSILPLTTTKRGIDASSEIYARLLDLMRQATKELIGFTNNYKNASSRKPLFESSKQLDLSKLNSIRRSNDEFTKMRSASVSGTMKYLKPYPKLKKKSDQKRISYSVHKNDFELVKNFLNLQEPSPKNVGITSFNKVLKSAKAFEE